MPDLLLAPPPGRPVEPAPALRAAVAARVARIAPHRAPAVRDALRQG